MTFSESESSVERPLVTVGGLIVAPDGEILLVQSMKWSNHYSVPGGKVELGETREDAIKREILEETGLKIERVCFACVQECIFSQEFFQKKHFVMHDFIAYLDASCQKDEVRLNKEAHTFLWILPQEALKLVLHHQCRVLIEWYLKSLLPPMNGPDCGIVGIEGLHLSCVVGIYPEEREKEQILIIDAKLEVDFARCVASSDVKDTVNYKSLADLCAELAKSQKYLLLETFASDFLDESFRRFPARWGWIRIRKPAALLGIACPFVELERGRGARCGHL